VPGQEFDLPLDVGDAEVSAVAFHPDKPVAYVAAGEHLFGSPPPPSIIFLRFSLSSSSLLSSNSERFFDLVFLSIDSLLIIYLREGGVAISHLEFIIIIFQSHEMHFRFAPQTQRTTCTAAH
jgi:hypothetical protein